MAEYWKVSHCEINKVCLSLSSSTQLSATMLLAIADISHNNTTGGGVPFIILAALAIFSRIYALFFVYFLQA